MAIYRRVKKAHGQAVILSSTVAYLKYGRRVKLVFLRDKHKKDCLALLNTGIHLADEDAIRIYGKRCDIEVFFKMSRQYLKFAKEIQCRDFDALIGHATIVFGICSLSINSDSHPAIEPSAYCFTDASVWLVTSHLSKLFTECNRWPSIN